MKPKYIIRFDDICPTINRKIWERIESILQNNNITPLIAVIPNNKDSKFKEDEGWPEFWEDVKKYQEDGWMIGLHGYDHKYLSHKSGILGISANTEFAGLAYDKQRSKIENGLKIFDMHCIHADAFVAPSHSFDLSTIRILKNNGINLISDGFLKYPFVWHGINWIPCQIWDKIVPQKDGLFTVCIHITGWDEERVDQFEENIREYKENIISPFDIKEYKTIGVTGLISLNLQVFLRKAKRILNKILNKK